MKIGFNKPTRVGTELKYIEQALTDDKLSGDGYFGKICEKWFENNLPAKRALLTPSCTAALELAAILMDINHGDEVIMPSFTFVSTANAFALRGANIIFVDISPDTMNIDEKKLKKAITDKTKAIVAVHYAGISCEIREIKDIARHYNLFLVEDAAQAITSKYDDQSLGTFGHFSTFSFHETKNITSGGEGGLLVINDEDFIKRAEVIREKGTDRSAFFRGEVSKYEWKDIGSSYLPSELQSAYLWAQLENIDEIIDSRVKAWKRYQYKLQKLSESGKIAIQAFPSSNKTTNGHIFYIKTKDVNERAKLIRYLRAESISSVFHYVPLHTSPGGHKFGKFHGEDEFTTKESERLLRLPIWHGISFEQIDFVVSRICAFYE